MKSTKLEPRANRRNAARRRKLIWRSLMRTHLATGNVVVYLPEIEQQ